ncbi:MAG TPA: TMEM165/GDT1 family protein [Candidatus Methylomirabilis sp.]|nr:TMEM165/GDT1 family protein [Candidatus Methylomirabilis sp.]
MTALWSSFLVVALAEMGDKTQLVALSLSSRYRRPWLVMGGILVATVLNHALASTLGAWVAGMVPVPVLAWVLGVSFIAFGVWTLFPDRAGETAEGRGWGPLLTTVVVFFLAEMGDKTQLATVALAARYHTALTVTIGSTMGMLAADGLAVFAGARLARLVDMRYVRWLAAALFFAFGAAAILDASGLL